MAEHFADAVTGAPSTMYKFVSRSSTENALEELIPLFSGRDGLEPTLREEIETATSHLGHPVRLAVAGFIKCGRSTLLNALLGRNIAATGMLETTFEVYEGATTAGTGRRSAALPATSMADVLARQESAHPVRHVGDLVGGGSADLDGPAEGGELGRARIGRQGDGQRGQVALSVHRRLVRHGL